MRHGDSGTEITVVPDTEISCVDGWSPDFVIVKEYVVAERPLKNACPHADEVSVLFSGAPSVTVASETGVLFDVTSTRNECVVFGTTTIDSILFSSGERLAGAGHSSEISFEPPVS